MALQLKAVHCRHRKELKGDRHSIDIRTFVKLIQDQLRGRGGLDRDCEPLGKQGARGALFKLTLASHGYTFVGKGTVSVFVEDLNHECQIYRKLERIQGDAVPVYLGNIDLINRDFLDVRVWIMHMLLMSWGGKVAEEDEGNMMNLKEEVQRSIKEIRRAGGLHGDVRRSNILWNRERKRAMLIDFERSTVTLQEMSPIRKRKRAEVWKEM
ncbi:MAG: hypothetical protein M1830_002527 [Pleopsidium flavum]|nr:MAG: hypothetical protein M1830_002527 [Pleopsidium flavum]